MKLRADPTQDKKDRGASGATLPFIAWQFADSPEKAEILYALLTASRKPTGYDQMSGIHFDVTEAKNPHVERVIKRWIAETDQNK